MKTAEALLKAAGVTPRIEVEAALATSAATATALAVSQEEFTNDGTIAAAAG